MPSPTLSVIIAGDHVRMTLPAETEGEGAGHAVVPLALDVRSAVIEALIEAIPGLDPRDATMAVDLARRVPVAVDPPRD